MATISEQLRMEAEMLSRQPELGDAFIRGTCTMRSADVIDALAAALDRLTGQCRAEFTVDGEWSSDGQLVTKGAVRSAEAALALARKGGE